MDANMETEQIICKSDLKLYRVNAMDYLIRCRRHVFQKASRFVQKRAGAGLPDCHTGG